MDGGPRRQLGVSTTRRRHAAGRVEGVELLADQLERTEAALADAFAGLQVIKAGRDREGGPEPARLREGEFHVRPPARAQPGPRLLELSPLRLRLADPLLHQPREL